MQTQREHARWLTEDKDALYLLPVLGQPGTSAALDALDWEHTLAADKSTLRAGDAPQVMSALTNLVITIFRLQGVTKITTETRRNAQNLRRPLQLLTLRTGYTRPMTLTIPDPLLSRARASLWPSSLKKATLPLGDRIPRGRSGQTERSKRQSCYPRHSGIRLARQRPCPVRIGCW